MCLNIIEFVKFWWKKRVSSTFPWTLGQIESEAIGTRRRRRKRKGGGGGGRWWKRRPVWQEMKPLFSKEREHTMWKRNKREAFPPDLCQYLVEGEKRGGKRGRGKINCAHLVPWQWRKKLLQNNFWGAFEIVYFRPPFHFQFFASSRFKSSSWYGRRGKKKASVKSFVRWKGGEEWELLASSSSSSRSVQNVLSLFWQHICYNLFLFLSPRQLCLEKAHCAQYSLKIVLQYFSSQ